MNVSGIILTACMYPFVLLMYVLLKNEATPSKGLYYGVSLSKEQRAEIKDELDGIHENYKKQMQQALWLMLLMPVPILFIPWFSILFSGWMLWMMISIFIFFIPFGVANGKLKALKEEKNWKREADGNNYVELKAAGNHRRIRWYHFAPQTAVTAMLTGWIFVCKPEAVTLKIMILSLAPLVLLFWVMAIWTDKQKVQVISENSDVNVNYARAKKNLWKKFWIVLTWGQVGYMFSMLVATDKWGRLNHIFTIATVIYIVFTAALGIWTARKKNALDQCYEEKGDVRFREDDDKWIWGMIYYNPKDRHTMVDKRIGVGSTINAATVGGKITYGFLGATLLSMPLVCVWIVLLEFTPIQLRVQENQVVAVHLREEYKVSIPAIEEAELIEELPKMSRNHGTSMEQLKKGSFNIKEEGNCDVFLNPENKVFLKLITPSNVYYLSGMTDEETEDIYEMIKKR